MTLTTEHSTMQTPPEAKEEKVLAVHYGIEPR